MRAPAFEVFDDGEEVADGAGEAVEAHDHEDIAGADLAHQPGEDGAGARGAGAVFLVEDLVAGGAKFVDLSVGGLVFGGDAGVADEASGGRGGRAGDGGGSGRRFRRFVQYGKI